MTPFLLFCALVVYVFSNMIVTALKIIDYAWMEKCLDRKDK